MKRYFKGAGNKKISQPEGIFFQNLSWDIIMKKEIELFWSSKKNDD